MRYPEIDEAASALGRALTIFQMSASHGMPALVLATHARIARDAADTVHRLCQEHPDAEVTIDTRLNEGMETAYRDVFGTSTDVPDTPEGLDG